MWGEAPKSPQVPGEWRTDARTLPGPLISLWLLGTWDFFNLAVPTWHTNAPAHFQRKSGTANLWVTHECDKIVWEDKSLRDIGQEQVALWEDGAPATSHELGAGAAPWSPDALLRASIQGTPLLQHLLAKCAFQDPQTCESSPCPTGYGFLPWLL